MWKTCISYHTWLFCGSFSPFCPARDTTLCFFKHVKITKPTVCPHHDITSQAFIMSRCVEITLYPLSCLTVHGGKWKWSEVQLGFWIHTKAPYNLREYKEGEVEGGRQTHGLLGDADCGTAFIPKYGFRPPDMSATCRHVDRRDELYNHHLSLSAYKWGLSRGFFLGQALKICTKRRNETKAELRNWWCVQPEHSI